MKWNVGAKIGAGFCLTTVVLLIVGAVAFQNTKAFVSAVEERRQCYQELGGINEVSSLLKDAETGQRGYLLTGQDRYLTPYTDADARLNGSIEKLRELFAGHNQQEQKIAKIQKDTDIKMSELRETIALRKDKGFEAAQQVVLSDTGRSAMQELRELVNALKADVEAKLESRSQELSRRADTTFTTIEYGIVVSALLTLLIGYLLTRSIARPLRGVTTVADRIALGDLSTELMSVRSDDEVGMLRNAFYSMNQSLRLLAGRATEIAAGNLRTQISAQSEKDVLGNAFAMMTQNLRSLMQEILGAVNVLATSASEIMASTTQLASGAAQTAAAVTETTTTVEEVKQTSQVSSQKGRVVADSSQRTAEVAQSGRRAVEETVIGMERIREQMESIAESIVRLSEQSQAIGEIIAVVDDLASQSNLLAVNASIEAAKAGEQGKGFAVVAQEVKSLADQSRHATTQVRAILSEIQKATSGAVMATEQGNKAVAAGMTQSQAAGEAIRLLSDNIVQASHTAMQIAVTSQEQFVGMDQVAMAMENIKVASVQTLTSTKQAETAAQNLHDLGQKLKRLVSKFKV